MDSSESPVHGDQDRPPASKTDVVASKWIAIAAIAAVFGTNSLNHASRRHKMLESTDLAQLPSDRSCKWEISDNAFASIFT